MRIKNQKHGKLNEQDMLQLATLLIKAGHTVRIGKEKVAGKQTSITYIEFDEQKNPEQ